MTTTTTSYQNFKALFNFEDFLISEGYTFFPKSSVKPGPSEQPTIDQFKYKIYKYLDANQKALNTIRVAISNDGHYVYKNLANDNDRGSIIDYLQYHYNMNSSQINEFIRSNSLKTKQIKINPKTSKQKEIPIQIISTLPYTPEDYYITIRKINDIITKHPYITESLAKISFINKSGNSCFGNCFLLRNHKKETIAYELKNGFYKKSMFLKERLNAFWYAIPPITKHIFIGESAIDVISYFKLFPSENTFLAASQGNISITYINEFKKLIPNHKNIPITLLNDNDINGHYYDLYWIINLFNLPIKAAKVIHNQTSFIQIYSTNKNIIEIPKSNLNLSQSHKAAHYIINYFTLNIHLNKPSNKDWNEDLLQFSACT